MKKRKYLEKLNLAVAAALILGSAGGNSFAQDSGLRGTVLTDTQCQSDDNGQSADQDGNTGCGFPASSES